MILSFSRDAFADKILRGTKKHTIRADKGKRWRFGLSIEFWRGNPRNVAHNPYKFAVAICGEVVPITIYPDNQLVVFKGRLYTRHNAFTKQLATDDGFDSVKDFFVFFKEYYNCEVFEGVLIYWHNIIAVARKEVMA